MNNFDIRTAIEKKRLKHFEVAYALGISPETFSRWLRKEIDGERKKAILDAIEQYKTN